MKFRNLLFDLDGTLTDSSEGIIKCAIYAFEKMGIEVPDIEELKTFIGPPLGDSFVKYGVAEADRSRSIDIFRERYIPIGKFENKPYPGMIDLLAKLKNEGFKLYVATSKPEKTAKEVLAHFDMDKYFHEIAGATMDGSRERKEEVIQYLLNKVDNVENDGDTVMIGDTAFDVRGAAELGIPCIGVTWGFGDLNEMREAGAIGIVETMEQLYEMVR